MPHFKVTKLKRWRAPETLCIVCSDFFNISIIVMNSWRLLLEKTQEKLNLQVQTSNIIKKLRRKAILCSRKKPFQEPKCMTWTKSDFFYILSKYKRVFVAMFPFHVWTAGPISTKFCTDLPTNSGKVLNTSITLPTRPLDPRVPQTPKPKWVIGEKTLCNVKCPDGYPYPV